MGALAGRSYKPKCCGEGAPPHSLTGSPPRRIRTDPSRSIQTPLVLKQSYSLAQTWAVLSHETTLEGGPMHGLQSTSSCTHLFISPSHQMFVNQTYEFGCYPNASEVISTMSLEKEVPLLGRSCILTNGIALPAPVTKSS